MATDDAVYLTSDQRGCIQRALWVRRDMLQHEMTRYEILAGYGDTQAAEALRIVRIELDSISATMRQLWTIHIKVSE